MREDGRIPVVRDDVSTSASESAIFKSNAYGFMRSMEKEGIEISRNSFFCFGAGKTGSAICTSLAENGARSVYIMDILPELAESLSVDLRRVYGIRVYHVEPGDYSKISDCNVIINASGVGEGDTVGKSPLPEEFIETDQFYFDAVSELEETAFLGNARIRGCRTMNGTEMAGFMEEKQFELMAPEFQKS
ncbi:MAG: hypothetical protein IKN92_00730 [Clostridia bacterium]|nr:hypothetical protein [Clostridia bacterium]